MVSSGSVNSDKGSVTSALSTYSSRIGELSSSWSGASYDSITSQAEEFSTSFSSSISSQMSDFAEACDLYEQYVSFKSELENARDMYNRASSNNETKVAGEWQAKISECQSAMEDLKSQINSKLASVSSVKLEATAI